MSATRDESGNVLCCHGRPIQCAECGEEYASDIEATPARKTCATCRHVKERKTRVGMFCGNEDAPIFGDVPPDFGCTLHKPRSA